MANKSIVTHVTSMHNSSAFVPIKRVWNHKKLL